MARIDFAELADLDIEGIFLDLTAKAGRPVAVKYYGLFEKLYDRLADYPESGAPRLALGRNIRIGVVAPFIVIYQYSEEAHTVTVLRVVDGRRRLSGALLAHSEEN